MHRSWSGTEVERNGDEGEWVACGGTLSEACLWGGHSSLHPFPLSVIEEWYCQGSGGLCDVCVGYVVEDVLWTLAGGQFLPASGSGRASGGLGALSPVGM